MTDSTTGPSAAMRVNWKAATWAGLIAGAVFMMMEMGLVAATGQSPWGPPRMIAAIAMGRDVLPPPATFDAAVLMVAMAIHMAVSVLLALVFAFLAARLGLVMAVVAGAVFGLLIYLVNFYGMTAFFPWFAMARNAISIVSHVAFGAVLALSYKLIAR
ncbi:hypothetical protein [Phenylobacterium sp.]|uniref:hypothetical protein n=1 Tax=Phenylobacterium sp. TaxID=1871053 RepID=UPI003982F2C4